jgi:hypothetical protein
MCPYSFQRAADIYGFGESLSFYNNKCLKCDEKGNGMIAKFLN